MIIDWSSFSWTNTPQWVILGPTFFWPIRGNGTPPPPVVTSSDESNKIRAGIVSGDRISDGNPSIGGMF